jgi:hypothetical protein
VAREFTNKNLSLTHLSGSGASLITYAGCSRLPRR